MFGTVTALRYGAELKRSAAGALAGTSTAIAAAASRTRRMRSPLPVPSLGDRGPRHPCPGRSILGAHRGQRSPERPEGPAHLDAPAGQPPDTPPDGHGPALPERGDRLLGGAVL